MAKKPARQTRSPTPADGPPAHHLRTGRQRLCPARRPRRQPRPAPSASTPSTTPPSASAPRSTSATAAKALRTTLNEKAMQIHLQRVVGAFVGSAFGAAPVLRHQKVSAGPRPHRQARQRRPRRGPRRRHRLREQGRARPPLRRRDGPAGLRPAGRRRRGRPRLRPHHRRGLEALRAAGENTQGIAQTSATELGAFGG